MREVGTTLDQYHAEFLERKGRERVRASTLASYRRAVRAILNLELDGKRIGDLPVQSLDARLLAKIRAELLDGGWSISSARSALGGSFRAMVREALEIDRLLEDNPFSRLPKWPRATPRRATPFSEAARARVLASLTGVERTFVYTLLFSGMRPSEATALRWTDLDLETGHAYVSKSRVLGEENAPKTAKSDRTVALLDEVVREIDQLERRSAYVFTQPNGRPFDYSKFSKGRFAKVLRGLGLNHRLYDCRHTFISWAITRGCNLRWIAEQVGNSQREIETTYARFLTEAAPLELSRLAGCGSHPAATRPEQSGALH